MSTLKEKLKASIKLEKARRPKKEKEPQAQWEWDGLIRITIPKDSVQEIKFLIQDGDKGSVANVSVVVDREPAGDGLVKACIATTVSKPLSNGDELVGKSEFCVYTKDEELYSSPSDDQEEEDELRRK